MKPATETYALLGAFVDELARCGMRGACTSPGSRCTPLVLSLAREQRLRCYSHIDERCASFFALGMAKASGLPVAVACTSGTAAAELLPAMIEAREARVPLLLLTADRPPELRENGAGQAIDQLKLFGDAAKWFFEVAPRGCDDAELRWMRTLACRAFWTSLEGRPGAVHLNFPLREPLILEERLPADATGRSDGSPYVRRTGAASGAPAGGDRGRVPVPALAQPERASARDGVAVDGGEGAQRPAVVAERTRSAAGSAAAARALGRALGAGEGPGPAAARLSELVAGARRGVVVAGRHERETPLGLAASAFAEAAAWPLLADPMSRARRGGAAVAHYDALLREPDFVRWLVPDLVIRVGDLPVSKPLRSWLAGLAAGIPQVALDPEGAWQDPASVVGESLALEPASALAGLAGSLAADHGARMPVDEDWLASWRSADELAAEAIMGALAQHELSEPRVAFELGVLLPARATLFVASSMPVRDIESFWPARADPPRVLCNRGANGIDGTVSSAFGAAAGADGPVVLLIGDVALAHDIGGLLAARRLEGRLAIVLLNNGGGGIFDFLPVARIPERRIYEQHIATATGLDFGQAAALYGLEHSAPQDVTGFRDALAQALVHHGSSMIEVRCTRPENVELHARAWRAVSLALNPRAAGAVPAA